jgi:Family of unknown function (DUF5696)
MDSQFLENAEIQVLVEKHEDQCLLELRNKTTGRTWPKVPIVALEVFDRAQQRVDRVDRFKTIHLRTVKSGVQLQVIDTGRGISASVWISVDQRGLLVRLIPSEIVESKPILYLLFGVDVLPGMMHSLADGELLLPINTGIVFRPCDKPALEDRFLIFGEQSRWELLPTLPVCSVQTPTGGLIAMATESPAETECRVATDGRGNGDVGLSFFLRGRDVDPVEPADREIRFIVIPPGKDITVFTAGVLRLHIMNDLGKPTLAQRAKESPEVSYLLGAYIMKLFYGIQMQGHSVGYQSDSQTPGFLVTMTFDEARAGLKAFHDAGVDRVYTQNVGWNHLGHDGAYPTRFPVEERVGGERGFRKLIAFGHEIGYQMTVHDNYLDAYEASVDFDPELVTMDCHGQPQIRGFWGGGPSYLLWPLAFDRRHVEEQMLQVKELGIRGPYYLDGMGSPLYINYHPKHRGTRSDLARGIDRLLRAGRDLFGSVATENGFLYCSITPDLVAHPGGENCLRLCRPQWSVTSLLERCVPLWQMTMSGLVVFENQQLEWPDTMRSLLFNQHPRYEWATRPGVHPVLNRAMIAKIKFRHDLLIKRFGHLRTQQITGFHREGHYQTTTFEDGTCVIGDFDKGDLQVNGKLIERAKEAF